MSAVLQKEDLSVHLHMDESLRSELSRAENSLAVAESFEIDCPEMAQMVATERTKLAQRIDRVKALRKGFLEPAEQIINNAKALFDPAIHALESSRNLLGTRLLAWDQAERARIAKENAEREAQARKARQEAEAKAAAELARANEIAAASRRQAQEAEEARRQAQAEGNARAAAAAAAESAKAMERAQAAQENATANAIRAQVEAAAAVVPVATVAKIAGTSVRDNWVAELKVNISEPQAKAMIVKDAISNPQLMGLLKVDLPAINKLAKALKNAMSVPGYEAVNKPTLAGSRK